MGLVIFEPYPAFIECKSGIYAHNYKQFLLLPLVEGLNIHFHPTRCFITSSIINKIY